MIEAIEKAIAGMRHSRLGNYIVPGLTSFLVGGDGNGRIRCFQSERETMEFVTPHSHRFDFTAIVLKGDVTNTLFKQSKVASSDTESWCRSTITQVCGMKGLLKYNHDREIVPTWWTTETRYYAEGDTYHMTKDEIHSIKFSKGAYVLFFEGPQLQDYSVMIEPWVNGKCIPTFKTADWMFERGTREIAA